MASFDINKVDNATELTDEEGYNIVRYYVTYYWMSGKFYSLKNEMELEDAISTVYLKMLQHNHFSKYNAGIATKKYFVCRAVFTTMVDMLRKYKEVYSLDAIDAETGLSKIDLVEDVHAQPVESSIERETLLGKLPNTTRSKIVGVGPDGKEINVSYRTLALLLEQGYSIREISEFYVNPKSGEQVTEGCISRYVRELREYVSNLDASIA